MAGGQSQLRIRRGRQRAPGEFLPPLALAGGNGGRRGRYQPARLLCGVGAQFGRAFQRQRGGGRPAPLLRLGGGGLQQRGHLLVRLQGGGGQVPRSPVGLVVEGLGELAVRGGSLREGGGVVDGGADEGMGELQ